jgi:ribose transport system substrate-binding protein
MVGRRVRRAACGIAVAALMVPLAACGSESSASSTGADGESKGAVAMSFGTTSNAVWSDMLDIMRPKIEAAGFEFLVDDPQFKVQKQAQDWDAWIARGDVKAIMAFPVQVDALLPVTSRATAADITVLGYTQNWEGTNAALLTDPEKDGERLRDDAAAWIKEQGAKVTVAVLTDRASDLSRGRSDALLTLSDVAPLATTYDLPAFSREDGYQAAKRQLVAHPETTVWIAHTEEPMKGVYQALMEAGVAADDPTIFMGAIDVVNESLDLISLPDSIWRIGYGYSTEKSANAVADMLIAAGNGEPVEDYFAVPLQVTAENADEFYVEE